VFVYTFYSQNSQSFKHQFSEAQGSWVLDSVYNETIHNIYFERDTLVDYFSICEPKIFHIYPNGHVTIETLNKQNHKKKLIFKQSWNKLKLLNGDLEYSDVHFSYTDSSLMISFFTEFNKFAYFLSRRSLCDYRLNRQESLSVLDYKQKIENARKKMDDEKNDCLAMSMMLNTGSNIVDDTLSLYSNGHRVNIYTVSQSANIQSLSKYLANEMMIAENKKHVACSYSSYYPFGRDVRIRAKHWDQGYFHPLSSKYLLSINLESMHHDLDKVNALKSYILKWYDYSWNRLSSGEGYSYANSCLERIFFDNDLTDKIKSKTLLFLSDTLHGPVQGNAYYCLYLLFNKNDELFSKMAARECLINSISIFDALDQTNHFNSEMLHLSNLNFKQIHLECNMIWGVKKDSVSKELDVLYKSFSESTFKVLRQDEKTRQKSLRNWMNKTYIDSLDSVFKSYVFDVDSLLLSIDSIQKLDSIKMYRMIHDLDVVK